MVHLARGKCHLRHQTRGEGGQGYHEHPPKSDIHACGLCLSGENKMTHIWLARPSNEVKLDNVDFHDLRNDEEEYEDHVFSPNF